MATRRVIAISLTLLTCSARANDVCSLKRANADKVVRLKNVPGYFFKVHPSGNYVTFIEGEHNSLVDMNSGKEYKTAGAIDPVWSPDGKFMTHPDQLGMKFFKGEDILKATLNEKLEEAEGTPTYLGGVYQSVGKINDTYRIISDADGISYADYKYDAGPEQLNYPTKPCTNLYPIATDLPMISKDGKYLSIYDKNSASTKIYKFDGKQCSLALDLGYGTGKVSFNADSTKIAFHVDQFADFENGYFSGVSQDKVKNVVVLDLEKTSDGKLVPQKWALASNNVKPGDGGYYPDFDAAGNLFYMEDLDNNFQLVKTSLSKLEFRPMESGLFNAKDCANCQEKKAPTPTDMLAHMWSSVCANEKALPKEFVMAMDGKGCQEMVDKFWTASLNVSKDHLKRSCPGIATHSPEEINQWDTNRKAKAEELLKGKCLACHRNPKTQEIVTAVTVWSDFNTSNVTYVDDVKRIEAIKLDKLNAKTAALMLKAISEGTMPKKEPLRDVEKKEISEYLRRKMLEGSLNEQLKVYTNVFRFSDEALASEKEKILAANPNLSEAEKGGVGIAVNCVYGQKNCNEYIALSIPNFENEAKTLPESERKKYVDDKVMEIRCGNLFEVTPGQCLSWQISK